MQKIGYIFLFILFNLQNIKRQNLVPNSSFEEIDSCNYSLGSLPTSWTPTDNFSTPDYYHRCAENLQLQVPEVLSCNILEPKEGDGYAGLISWGPFGREYLQAKLDETLKKDQLYYIEFSVSPQKSCGSEDIFTDKIGINFTEAILNKYVEDAENTPIFAEPVLENKDQLINEIGIWNTFQGCYTASGNENALQIGNFYTDAQTMVEPPGGLPSQGAYFFVDDVKVIPFDLFPDTLLLCEDELIISADFLDTVFQWNTNEISNAITVNEGGDYDAFININGCLLRDKTYVLDVREKIETEIEICEDPGQILRPGIIGDYSWSTGETTATISVTKSGIYTATIDNECGMIQFQYEIIAFNCACDVYIPNTFTPNNDAINDKFQLFFECKNGFEILDFSVYDRWGSRIYFSTDSNEEWDGRINGKDVESGTYRYKLLYKTNDGQEDLMKINQGYITIIR